MNLISYIRSSIKLKFMLMVAFVFTFLILLVAIANVVFLPKYYQFRKLSSLSSTMTKVNSIINKEDAFLEDTDGHRLAAAYSGLSIRPGRTTIQVLAADNRPQRRRLPGAASQAS